MAVVETRTVSLPADRARTMDDPVGAGGHASASAVARAGLRALRGRDAAVAPTRRERTPRG